VIGQRLARNGKAAHVGRAVAGDAKLEEACLAELGHKGAALAIDVVAVMRAEVCARPVGQARGEGAVTLLVEGPVEVSHP
jgi:hypothetical protein